MKLINVRSPYIININQEIQTAGKIEIRIWNPNGYYPEVANYTLVKSAPSPSQTEVTFNISPFIKDWIENRIEIVESIDLTDFNYVNVEVKEFFKTSVDDYSLINTETFIALKGYTDFIGGVNQFKDADNLHSLSNVKDILYDRSKLNKYYLQVYVPNGNYKAVYKADYRKVEFDLSEGINNIPLTQSNSYFDEGNYLYIVDTTAITDDCCTTQDYTIKAIPVCEPILTPVICTFINRHGAIQQLTFFKMATETFDFTNDKYNLMPSNWNYDNTVGTYKQFNFNGKKTIKMNTGFVPETYSELIKDLLVSENIWIDEIPATIKTQSLEVKTQIRNKNINYEVEFEFGFDVINSIV